MTPADQQPPIDSRDAIGRFEVRPIGSAGFKDATADQVGRTFPLGATVLPDGVNFTVFSRTRMTVTSTSVAKRLAIG
jgi:hypothetical protein